jgi:plastocyanin
MRNHLSRAPLGIAIVLAATLAGCGSSGGSVAPPPSAPAGGAVITAQNTKFDRAALEVPAGKPFQLLFENREGVPHNVRIYAENPDQPLFTGEIFSGPGSRTYDVPALPAGAYKFRCDVHTDMAGAVTAG